MPPDAPRLAPAIARAITATGVVPDAVTADRGYGQTSVDETLGELGVERVAILRKGQPGKARQNVEAADDFVELVKWCTGAEGRIAALKRQHGWGRARTRELEGARTWCGWGVLSHSAIKSPPSPTDPATTAARLTNVCFAAPHHIIEARINGPPTPRADPTTYFFRASSQS